MTEDDRLSHLPLNARLAVPMLRAAWKDALVLKESRTVWRELRAPVSQVSQFGKVGLLLWHWYRDHVLAGCRRLLDDGRDVSSPVRALRLVQKDAPELTVDVLCRVAGRDDPLARADIERGIGDLANGGATLTRAVVGDSIQRLTSAHEQVTKLATRVVAHRMRGSDAPPISEDDIDGLLHDVVEVVRQWTALLYDVRLAEPPPGGTGVEAVRTALELFDRQQFIKALSEAQARVGPGATAEVYNAIERSTCSTFRGGNASLAGPSG